MNTYALQTLLRTPLVTIVDAVCPGGSCAHQAPADLVSAPHLIFPYRGVYVRRVAGEQVVAEPNQVLFANADEPCSVSHPTDEGDASLLAAIEPEMLVEIARTDILRQPGGASFVTRRVRLDSRAQALVAMLRYSLRHKIAEPLEAESLALTLAQRAVGGRTSHKTIAGAAQRRLVDRVKLVLTADLARRWTLAAIAAKVGGSPVYLTQVFRQVEGVPLYRYQLRLRLARALDLMSEYEDLSALGFELGFSSHSHFTVAFRQAYDQTPTEFRDSVLQRKSG
jgi:AraC-like DNA-binding protein